MKGWSSTVQFKVTAEDVMIASTNCTSSALGHAANADWANYSDCDAANVATWQH
jgi:hypothetical protein